MVDIKEVAKLASVSIASVSRVVNNSRSVSEEVRNKVNDALKELNYVPNTLAKSMRTQKSNYIGVIVSDIKDPFFAELYTIIENKVKESGYKTILINGPFDDVESTVQSLFHWNIEGVIICFSHIKGQWSDILRQYKKRIPFVIMETIEGKGDYNRVFIDVEEGMYRAVKYLINHGHKRIAYFRGNASLPDGRYKGYLRALEESEIDFDQDLLFECEYDIFGGQLAASELLSLKNKPSAIVTINDTIALGAMKFFLKNNIRIPEDISIIGFDDNMIAGLTYPELSTVRIPIKTLAVNATKILLKSLRNNNNKISNILIQTELILRETTS
jgi:DNA-binding LacI/PurR family transcriptional regulator